MSFVEVCVFGNKNKRHAYLPIETNAHRSDAVLKCEDVQHEFIFVGPSPGCPGPSITYSAIADLREVAVGERRLPPFKLVYGHRAKTARHRAESKVP